jgi:streptogramin lyase
LTIAGKAGTTGSADGTNSTARFNYPQGVAADTGSNLFVADSINATVRKLTPQGTNWVTTTIAGKALAYGSADGTNSNARFGGSSGAGMGQLAVDSSGNVYVVDPLNNTVRKIAPVGTDWVTTTIAGKTGATGSADGTNSAARFNAPNGITVDAGGNLFVADAYNQTIRKLTPLGTDWATTTIAGSAGQAGSADGTNRQARFNFGDGNTAITVDRGGNVFVTDHGNHTIRKLTPEGTNWVTTTIAGKAGIAGSADGTNSAARFNGPYGIAVDGIGNVIVADFGNYTIRKLMPAVKGSVPENNNQG